MAKATISHPEPPPVVTLELTIAEAQYIEDALWKVEPEFLDTDTPWEALNDAFNEAHIDSVRGAANAV